ncbi:MAG: glycosyltransferase family 4 protein [Anaerolineae bacterium]|nr:glycosyltransferase family 4 protein [Anaerolineae bacterium]
MLSLSEKQTKPTSSSAAAATTRPLRILMVTPTSFFADYGGHVRILEETLALQRLGHTVTIVTYYKGNDVPGLDIRRTAPLPYRTEYEVGSSRHKIAFDLYLFFKAWRVAWQIRPDIIHGHMHEGALIGGLLARALRVPLVFDFQGSLSAEMVDHNFLKPGGLPYRFVHRLEKFICRLPQATLTSSLRSSRLLAEQFTVPPEHIHPLPDCVDITRFDPARFTPTDKESLRYHLGIPPDQPIVAYLGLLADYQGTPHLIEAAAYLQQSGRQCHFLIMGFPHVERYRTLAQAYNVADTVTLTGKVPYETAPLFLSLGDIAVSAKMSKTEGSGKLLNYMAMAQPIVAYDTPVHREYLEDLGAYAPEGDVPALAEAIWRLVQDPAHRTLLGQQLRQRAAAHYSWHTASEQIVALYRRLTP